jgi:dTDP-4-dehydrorhamnose reductase
LTNNLYQKGIFHIHSPNTVNKYELLKIFNEVYDLKMKINTVEAKEKVDRTLSSIYPFSSEICTKMLKQQVEEMREFFQLKGEYHGT